MTNKTVVLEGFHACKHAVRFNADIVELVTADKDALENMLAEYATDVQKSVMDQVREITQAEFDQYSSVVIRTPLAGKATVSVQTNYKEAEGLVVLLENPRSHDNIGAVVRTAAGMNAGAVVCTGDVDPWHKNAVRTSQGLHYALPVTQQNDVQLPSERQLVVFDESGQDVTKTNIKKNAVLVFGSERTGVSQDMLNRADVVVCIPQAEGVSSYNLAASVAMGLYHAMYNKKHDG